MIGRLLPVALFVIASLLVGLCCLPGTAEAKLPKGVTWQAQLGYGGYVQKNRVNCVIVDMENNSPDKNVSGDLVLEYDGIEYFTKLELPTPSKKRFFLYFPCGDNAPLITLRVRAKGFTDEVQFSAWKNTLEPADINLLVLSNQKGSLGVLNGAKAARVTRNIGRSEQAGIEPGRVAVSYLRADEVDATPKFFSCADIIVLGDIDYQQMKPELAESLKAALAGGKTLVFSLGLNGAGVAASPLNDVCPLQPNGTTMLANLGRFGQRYGIQVSGAPALFATGAVSPGSTVLAWSGQHPAIVRREWGSGTALALAFDFTQLPFKQNPKLADVMQDHALRVTDTLQLDNWFIHPWPISKVLSAMTEAKPMEPQFVLLFLLAYVAMIGPLNFFILDRFKRRTLVWSTIPLIIAGFSFMGLYTGYARRGSNNVVAYFQELHVYPDAAYTPYQTVMMVFSADRSKYELKVPDRSAFLYSSVPAIEVDYNPLGGGQALAFTGGRLDNSAEPVLKTTQGKWDPRTYYYQGFTGLQAQASSQLQAVRGDGGVVDLSGTFTIDLPFDLSEAYLIAQGYEKQLGTLAGQGAYDISQLSPGGSSRLDSESYLVQRLSELINREKDSARLPVTYRNEALLVGFTEDVSALAEIKAAHKEHRLSMVVVHLPYKASYAKSSSWVLSRALIQSGSSFEPYDRYARYSENPGAEQQYRLDQDGYVDVMYELAGNVAEDRSLHISLQAAHASGDERLDLGHDLSVEVLRGGTWDAVRVADGTSVDIDVDGALNELNQVVVRFTAKEDLIFTIPLSRNSVY